MTGLSVSRDGSPNSKPKRVRSPEGLRRLGAGGRGSVEAGRLHAGLRSGAGGFPPARAWDGVRPRPLFRASYLPALLGWIRFAVHLLAALPRVDCFALCPRCGDWCLYSRTASKACAQGSVRSRGFHFGGDIEHHVPAAAIEGFSPHPALHHPCGWTHGGKSHGRYRNHLEMSAGRLETQKTLGGDGASAGSNAKAGVLEEHEGGAGDSAGSCARHCQDFWAREPAGGNDRHDHRWSIPTPGHRAADPTHEHAALRILSEWCGGRPLQLAPLLHEDVPTSSQHLCGGLDLLCKRA